jgi:DMSO reductase family type II enzyme heme b subunit
MNALNVTAKKAAGAVQDLLSPRAPAWNDASEVSLPLQPTPLDAQPSAYVRKVWDGRQRGDIPSVSVKALAASGQLVLRLNWAAADPRHAITDNDVFADACAVLFPANGKDAELATMGSADRPVTVWYWRAGADAPNLATARGLGTVSREAKHSIQATGEWQDGSWQVVLAGPASATKIGVAVWSGTAGERAGLKSHTPSWHDLKVG